MNPNTMYDAFSMDYDRFVNWPARLSAELPFLVRQLKSLDTHQVLDTACGTGMHAIALASQGYQVAGADLSPRMVERARKNAVEAGAEVRFEIAGFGELSKNFGEGSFDALLCLGNSLPHVTSLEHLNMTLSDFASCLRPGGILILQNRNFNAVLAKRERWMEPQSHGEGDWEWLFIRFYDFESSGLITFNVLSLSRQEAGAWTQQIMSTSLLPLPQALMVEALLDIGFTDIVCYGSMAEAPFEPETSGNLVITALKRNMKGITGTHSLLK